MEWVTENRHIEERGGQDGEDYNELVKEFIK